MHARPRISVVLLVAAALAGCGDDDSVADRSSTSSLATPDQDALPIEGDTPTGGSATTTSTTGDQLFPDVVGATATFDSASDTWQFAATISSPYDTPERYADAWRVVGPENAVYGVRELTHDHADEQPFTRSLSGVVIPVDVDEVTIEARDQVNGWGGERVTVQLVRP